MVQRAVLEVGARDGGAPDSAAPVVEGDRAAVGSGEDELGLGVCLAAATSAVCAMSVRAECER
jgi:hypothetical protein